MSSNLSIKEKPMISVIIRCYNEEKHIAKLLTGISRQTRNDTEIILVDSGSTDATLSIAAKFGVKIVYISPEEFSFGKALNRGCHEASGDILVFISAHCYPVYPDWLESLTEPFKNPSIVLSFGRQTGDDTTKFSERQIFSLWFPGESDYSRKEPFCNNANAAIRKLVWEQYPFNEELTGLEDVAWAKQVQEKGYHIAYKADAVIVHVHNETLEQVKNRYFREAIALKNIFPGEFFSFWDFIHLYLRNVISDLHVASREKCLHKTFRQIVTFRYMQFWGTYQGFSSGEVVTPQLKRTFYYPARAQAHQDSGSPREQIDYSHLKK
jgi:rhamnosyltransferase